MATETARSEDVVLLNAFVDGELSPAERAAVASRLASDPDFAHLHLTLARLKASLAASAEAAPGIVLPPRRRRIPPAAVAAAGAAIGCIAILAGADIARHRPAPPEPSPATAITLADLPSHPLLPHLEIAGLSLVAISTRTAGGVPLVEATYRGPHGCRLDLRAGSAGRDWPAPRGSSRQRWTVDDLHYELVAHGMPAWRFALVAAAAESQTRSRDLPRRLERRLREARAAAPPCAG